MLWTKDRLTDVARSRLSDTKLVIVANREPYIHTYENNHIVCNKPASGLTTALDPVMQATGGVWIAHGSGQADALVTDSADRVAVPPEEPTYSLRRVWLSKEEEKGYYYGFANETLWPLCHAAYVRPLFDLAHWEQYRKVNQKFADAVLEETLDQPAIVFIQDYHFALLPRMIKNARPDLVVLQFWHIPWPNREIFRICPWQDEILDGLLGNDLLSFHIQYHCNNFLETVDRAIESRIDLDRFAVTRRGHRTLVRPHPISIDADVINQLDPEELTLEQAALRQQFDLADQQILVGVERADYTKGLPDRFRAIDRLLTLYPEHKGRFCLLQVGAPSRTSIPSYRNLNEELLALVDQINRKHGSGSWQPIRFITEHCGPCQVHALYRMADACVVSSLHDGMNLVAKEFVAARTDLAGVLVLSKFTGAAKELTDALLINPYSQEEFAEALHQALTMPLDEQRLRMQQMREIVIEHNVYRWAGKLLVEASKLRNMSFAPSNPFASQPEFSFADRFAQL
jgi:trehalose 6-phosphate synthase